MKIGDLLQKKPERKIEGRSIAIRLITYLGESAEEEIFFGKVKKSAKNGILVQTAEGELLFPPQQEMIYPANGESFSLPDGKCFRPELSAVFSLYGKERK